MGVLSAAYSLGKSPLAIVRAGHWHSGVQGPCARGSPSQAAVANELGWLLGLWPVPPPVGRMCGHPGEAADLPVAHGSSRARKELSHGVVSVLVSFARVRDRPALAVEVDLSTNRGVVAPSNGHEQNSKACVG